MNGEKSGGKSAIVYKDNYRNGTGDKRVKKIIVNSKFLVGERRGEKAGGKSAIVYKDNYRNGTGEKEREKSNM